MNIALLGNNFKPASAHVLLKKVRIAQDSILHMGFGLTQGIFNLYSYKIVRDVWQTATLQKIKNIKAYVASSLKFPSGTLLLPTPAQSVQSERTYILFIPASIEATNKNMGKKCSIKKFCLIGISSCE